MAGSTFADTLARYPQVFGYIFIGLIKAGEEAGELEKTLGRINELLTKQDNIKSKVVGILMYPMFVKPNIISSATSTESCVRRSIRPVFWVFAFDIIYSSYF